MILVHCIKDELHVASPELLIKTDNPICPFRGLPQDIHIIPGGQQGLLDLLSLQMYV